MDVLSAKPAVVNQSIGSVSSTNQVEQSQPQNSNVSLADTVTISAEARLLLEEEEKRGAASLMNGGGTEPPPIPPKGTIQQ